MPLLLGRGYEIVHLVYLEWGRGEAHLKASLLLTSMGGTGVKNHIHPSNCCSLTSALAFMLF